jgi:6-pyruvoyltetrahydropterin/6-carboxytetrahydropterin synthase
MHSLMVKKDFIASHFLIGGDWGDENYPHSHHYDLELILKAKALNQHEYLVDIVEVESQLGKLIGRFKDKLLNDSPDFGGRNPSIELFSKILCTHLAEKLGDPRICSFQVILWETDSAWAGYEILKP